MRVLTILGTRPEIIRLSRIIPALDQCCEHRVLHTGQNYDPGLNELFFNELGLRAPDRQLVSKAPTPMRQIANILTGVESDLQTWRPDRVLLLGDTNSALAAFTAKRMGIPVLHMEAGNRSFDDRGPEEINRRLIDHCSDILLPYTERSRANLLNEGIAAERIFVTGNPIAEVLSGQAEAIQASQVLDRLGLKARKYFLVTLHRAENVDHPERLQALLQTLSRLAAEYQLPMICSTHPRTRERLSELAADTTANNPEGLRWLPPFGLHDFVRLEQEAFCVLSDSGTVQEECALFGIPSLTLREVTERPETLESGSSLLVGTDADKIFAGVALVSGENRERHLKTPAGASVSQVVARIMLGHHRVLGS